MAALFERFMSVERRSRPTSTSISNMSGEKKSSSISTGIIGVSTPALTATVISYRSRSAIREVGKVFGLSKDVLDVLASSHLGLVDGGCDGRSGAPRGPRCSDPRLNQALSVASDLSEFPRHLSQHVGGFVISETHLDEMVPIENAAMEDRNVIEWDKDDLDVLEILKVDVLGLGCCHVCAGASILLAKSLRGESTLFRAFRKMKRAVYDMISRRPIGVFQVESRAQMSMLPRLKPGKFYDLVIEVAIVRPGPIQGDMVHPICGGRREFEKNRISFSRSEFGPKDELKKVLQQDARRSAVSGAGDADRHGGGGISRRAKPSSCAAPWQRLSEQERSSISGRSFIDGMYGARLPAKFAEMLQADRGFGEYGFPESHAASFALLVYASAWIKCHYPDVFRRRCSTASRWVFTRPRSSCATRRSMASRCDPST